MKMYDVRKQMKVGKFAKIKWDNGEQLCLVVDKEDDGRITKNTSFQGFFFNTQALRSFDADQIVTIGDFLDSRCMRIREDKILYRGQVLNCFDK